MSSQRMSSTQERKLGPQEVDEEATGIMNLTLMDPPRWGWAAVGGVADLLPPHERARRKSTRTAFRKQKRRNHSRNGTLGKMSTAPTPSTDSMTFSQKSDEVFSATPACKTPPAEVASNVPSQQFGSEGGDVLGLGLYCPSTKDTATKMSKQCQLDEMGSGTCDNVDDMARSSSATGALQQTPREINQSVKRWGLPIECLGISLLEPTKIRPKDATNEESNNPTESNDSTRQERIRELEVNSLKDGMIDMYSYHRGREGMEPRDQDSGELLCDLEPTDTMHDWDTPKMTTSIVIEFPLHDEATDKLATDKAGSSEIARYRDTVQWDLADSTAPTPMTYATNIATEFGLTYGQTLDLAISIQRQLDAHVAQNCVYNEPITSKDPSGNDRLTSGPPRLTHRYGAVRATDEPGGTSLSKKEISQRQRKAPNLSRRHTSGVSNTSSRRRGLVRPPPERQTVKTVIRHVEEQEEIEQKYLDEVLKRAKKASALDCLERAKVGMSGPFPLEKKLNHHCHICHKRCLETYIFPCRNISHSYCANHCKQRLGLKLEKGVQPKFDYCPVCAISCACSKCSRRVDAVARALKIECEEQGTALEGTKFDDILSRCSVNVQPRTYRVVSDVTPQMMPDTQNCTGKGKVTGMSAEKVKGPKTPSRRGKGEDRERPMVPRPPPSEFPREVCGMRDLEPGSATDYATIYTADGKFICERLPEILAEQNAFSTSGPSDEAEIAEDGNVDYCHVCKNHGNLLCCDYCPRAFHPTCIKGEVQPSGAKWECFVCRQDAEATLNDLVDGKSSLNLICASFVEADIGFEGMEQLKVLSIIHEMVTKLIDYDFGYMFGQPVNLDEVSGYKEIVKNPMDLGTIGSRLISGGYASQLKARNSWDDVVVAVLKDIELVWHNCFTFNYEGSAIYRMADVHRRKSQSIRKRSFEHLLSDQVKTTVDEFVMSCEQARGSSSAASSTLGSGVGPIRPKGKHKIAASMANSGVTRPVAVLDPSSSRVVKIYSSMKSASLAAQFLANLGLESEWATINDPNVKGIIHKSAADPSILLFGYRWLVLDDLRNGKVKFSKLSVNVLEMKHQSKTHVFFSIEEALSSPNLPKNASIEQLRQQLACLPRGNDWAAIGDRSWRRPVLRQAGPDENESPDTKDEDDAASFIFDMDGRVNESYMSNHSIVSKHDLVSGRRLIGFDSIQAAFEDWVGTCECSPSFPNDEPTTIEHYREFYLDGDRNVDAIVWRTISGQSDDTTAKIDNSRAEDTENVRDNVDISRDACATASVPFEEANPPEMERPPRVELALQQVTPVEKSGIVLNTGCDVPNGDQSVQVGKRKISSLGKEIDSPVKRCATAREKNAVETSNRRNGTQLKNGNLSSGLIP